MFNRIIIFSSLICVLINSLNAQNWRNEAFERIDSIRKSELYINLLSVSGHPLNGASVKIKLKRHAFNWGAVTRANHFINSPHIETYKNLYLNYFNSAGFSLGLKPKHRGLIAENEVESAMPWFNANNFHMRGHAMIWEGESFFPTEEVSVYNSTVLANQQKGDSLVNMLDDHIYHVIPKWNVECWDVVNEPVVNQDVNDLLPNKNTLVHWFKLADSLRQFYGKTNLKLALNENQIISNNSPWVVGKIGDFMDIIDSMLMEGAPIEILGFQSRIKYGMLPADSMYNRLVSFEKYGLPYEATEFEIRNTNNYTYTDAEVKQLTEETMIIYFSHPFVNGFWHWTFIDEADDSRPYALFNYDGTPQPTGEKWIELMEGVFDTDTTLLTNFSGNCSTRGFKGEYDIEITYGDSTYITSLSLNNDTVASINTPFTFSSSPGTNYCGSYTSSPPIILNGVNDSTISGLEITNPSGHCISIRNCNNITIHQCKLGSATGNGIDIYNSDNILIYDCRIDSVASGVYANSCTQVQVINNSVKNVIGPMPRGQMVQFNKVNGVGNKINYNVAENILGESNPEDVISIFKSNGTSSDYIQVKGNWIRGGGPSNSGGGIMTGDAGGSKILVENNILVDPGQYGIAISSGDSIEIIENIIYAKEQSFTNVGIYVWNQYQPSCSNHRVFGNQVNWINNNGLTNHKWNGNNCGPIIDWTSNFWGANIDSTILPAEILQPKIFIADNNFEAYLENNGMGDGIVGNNYISKCNINNIQILDVSNQNISDLTGISYFTGLISLNCKNNSLTSLDISQNTALQKLNCRYNQISSLDVTQNTSLTILNCSDNNLSSIDISKNNALTKFSCEDNQLSAIDVSNNTDLNYFICGDNQITSLDVSNNILLNYFGCHGNQLSAIDVSNNTSLEVLSFGKNSLTTIDVSSNTLLTEFRCYENQLTALDLSLNTNLSIIDISYNPLTCFKLTNGNNININVFDAVQNPNLNCIEVDDPNWSNANWINTDAGTTFSINCNYPAGCF